MSCRRGIAATISLFMYIFVTILVRDFGPGEALPFLAYIVLYAVLVLVSTHGQGDLLTVSMFPFIGITMLIHLRLSPELVLILALCTLMAVEATRNLVRDGISFPGGKACAWRSIARLLVSLVVV